MTQFGRVSLSKDLPWIKHHKDGLAISPLVQSWYTEFCAELVPEKACTLLNLTLGPGNLTDDSQAYRLIQEYGRCEQVKEELEKSLELDEYRGDLPAPQKKGKGEVIYMMFDGGLFPYDDGYREAKIGRVFLGSQIEEVSGKAQSSDNEKLTTRRRVLNSEYVLCEGHYQRFVESFGRLVQDYVRKYPRAKLVVLKDGAEWMENYVSKQFPQATSILDFYHAYEYLCEFAVQVFKDEQARESQLELWKSQLRNGQVEELIKELETYRRDERSAVCQGVETVLTYYTKRRNQMRYKAFREQGLLIGSGAIESAVKCVAQQRCKLSGQRWGNGLQPVFNLRAIYKSGKGKRMERIILSRFQKVA